MTDFVRHDSRPGVRGGSKFTARTTSGCSTPFSEATIGRARLPPHRPVPAAELGPAGDQGCRRDGDGRPARKRLRGLDKEEAEEIYQKFKEAKPSTPGTR